MQITHMTMLKVAHGAALLLPELWDISDEGLNGYVSDHVTGLREMTKRRGTLPGLFVDPEAQRLFRDLFSGTNEAFLAASASLGKRLIDKMDGRTSPGLLICLRADDKGGQYAGALKLQVRAERGATLEELASGKVQLHVVKDLLDKPGDLQKGALCSSSLPEEHVMVGDQLGYDAAYFPVAFGIRAYGRVSTAVPDLLAAVVKVYPALAAPVANVLPDVPSGEPREVLAALGEKLPELTDAMQAEVAETLATLRRPVGYIDTSRPATETIKVGTITISGPITQMRQLVRIEPSVVGARWTVTIDSDREPNRTHP